MSARALLLMLCSIAAADAVLGFDVPCGSSSECAKGSACKHVPVLPNATRYCVGNGAALAHPMACGHRKDMGCCSDKDCHNATTGARGTCDNFPGSPECIPYPEFFNVCVWDECDASKPSSCGPGKVCIQGGAFGFRRHTCVRAQCSEDRDCQGSKKASKGSARCKAFAIAADSPQSCDEDLKQGGFFCTGGPGSQCTLDSDCKGRCKGYRCVCFFNTTANEPQCGSLDPPPPSPAPVTNPPTPAPPASETGSFVKMLACSAKKGTCSAPCTENDIPVGRCTNIVREGRFSSFRYSCNVTDVIYDVFGGSDCHDGQKATHSVLHAGKCYLDDTGFGGTVYSCAN